MNILIISANREREPYAVSPIGASYVASSLKKAGHEALILDLCFEEDLENAIANAVSSFSPDIIGLSIRNIDNLTFGKSVDYIPSLRSAVEVIKNNTAAPIVAGGAGFSIFPEETLRCLDIEAGIVGEGEQAFVLFADGRQSGRSPETVPNLCMIRGWTIYSQ